MSQEDARPAELTTGAGKGTTEKVDETWTPSYGLRLRRQASWRLVPLDCGHRDPLDCQHPFSAERVAEPYEGDYWFDVGAHLTMAELAAVAS